MRSGLRRTLLPLAACALVTTTAAAGTRPAVEGGTIVPGRGVGAVEVGMTRAQVVSRLGEPLQTIGANRLLYSRDNVFDVYLDDSGRVATVTASGSRFCTRGGACLLKAGNVARLRREFPGRIEKAQGYGRPLYTITSRLRGSTVYTSFFGDRHAPTPTVLEVFVGYCRGTPCA